MDVIVLAILEVHDVVLKDAEGDEVNIALLLLATANAEKTHVGGPKALKVAQRR